MITGAQWIKLPYYYGSKSAVHARFMAWVKSGVFAKILQKSIEVATSVLGSPESFFFDTSSSKAPLAKFSGKNPTDRSKRGIKKGIVIDWNRIILSVAISAANIHDAKLLMPHVPQLKSFTSKPIVCGADAAFDVKSLRTNLAKNNIVLFAATNVRRSKNKKKLKPGGRWKVEHVFGIQQWNRGIKLCWTKLKETFLALCQFASAIHNFKRAGISG